MPEHALVWTRSPWPDEPLEGPAEPVVLPLEVPAEPAVPAPADPRVGTVEDPHHRPLLQEVAPEVTNTGIPDPVYVSSDTESGPPVGGAIG
eukprot:9720028-Heterocapsa_arctica.AAC.1